MSIDLILLIARLFVTSPNTVVFSVCIGVGGCLRPILSRVRCAGIAYWQFITRAPSSASDVDEMTAFII